MDPSVSCTRSLLAGHRPPTASSFPSSSLISFPASFLCGLTPKSLLEGQAVTSKELKGTNCWCTLCNAKQLMKLRLWCLGRFAHQLHAEHIQMWITHGTDLC